MRTVTLSGREFDTFTYGRMWPCSGAKRLLFTASSSSSLILPNSRVVFTGTGAQRTVQLRPGPGESGSAVVTLRVSDGSVMATTAFTLTSNPDDPALLVHAGTNWRYIDTGANPANWQMFRIQ